MKRNIIFTLTIVLTTLLQACSKSDDANPQSDKEVYVRCKMDGKQKNFNYFASGNDRPSTKDVHFVTVSGREENDIAKSPSLGFSVYKENGSITSGDYSSSGTDYDASSSYVIQEYENGKFKNSIIYAADGSEGNDFKLTITSLTDWGIKGKFSGKYNILGTDKWITITDGEFSVPYNY